MTMESPTIERLLADLADNPMDLLEIPESIFELYELDPLPEFDASTWNTRSVTPSSSASGWSSFSSSRCESFADLEALVTPDQDEAFNLAQLIGSEAVEKVVSILETCSPASSQIDDDSLINADQDAKAQLTIQNFSEEPSNINVTEIFSNSQSDPCLESESVRTRTGTITTRPAECTMCADLNDLQLAPDSVEMTELSRGRSGTIVSRPSDTNLCANFSTLDLDDIRPSIPNMDEIKRSRTVSESSSRSESVGKIRKVKRSRRNGGSVTNVLHFLKRLLDDSKYESIINWRDKEKGIFAIDDRQGMLDIWNENKSRPVKNWNNFAKTLRTHYKHKSQGQTDLHPQKSQFTWKFSQDFLQNQDFLL